jgi:hypothetical protein
MLCSHTLLVYMQFGPYFLHFIYPKWMEFGKEGAFKNALSDSEFRENRRREAVLFLRA